MKIIYLVLKIFENIILLFRHICKKREILCVLIKKIMINKRKNVIISWHLCPAAPCHVVYTMGE